MRQYIRTVAAPGEIWVLVVHFILVHSIFIEVEPPAHAKKVVYNAIKAAAAEKQKDRASYSLLHCRAQYIRTTFNYVLLKYASFHSPYSSTTTLVCTVVANSVLPSSACVRACVRARCAGA